MTASNPLPKPSSMGGYREGWAAGAGDAPGARTARGGPSRTPTRRLRGREAPTLGIPSSTHTPAASVQCLELTPTEGAVHSHAPPPPSRAAYPRLVPCQHCVGMDGMDPCTCPYRADLQRTTCVLAHLGSDASSSRIALEAPSSSICSPRLSNTAPLESLLNGAPPRSMYISGHLIQPREFNYMQDAEHHAGCRTTT